MGKRTTPEQIEKVIEMAGNGIRPTAIAVAIEKSEYTVRDIMRKNGFNFSGGRADHDVRWNKKQLCKCGGTAALKFCGEWTCAACLNPPMPQWYLDEEMERSTRGTGNLGRRVVECT